MIKLIGILIRDFLNDLIIVIKCDGSIRQIKQESQYYRDHHRRFVNTSKVECILKGIKLDEIKKFYKVYKKVGKSKITLREYIADGIIYSKYERGAFNNLVKDENAFYKLVDNLQNSVWRVFNFF